MKLLKILLLSIGLTIVASIIYVNYANQKKNLWLDTWLTVCRENMLALATTEELYYADHKAFSNEVGALALYQHEVGMQRCPKCGQFYNIESDGYYYKISCPYEKHGHIENGIASWDLEK
jgi:hypothetical protein